MRLHFTIENNVLCFFLFLVMETNGNSHEGSPGVTPGLTPTPQGSLESLSEYTDAHEDTASAPTEFLAEVHKLIYYV
jgi:hypothetical protein